LFLFYLLVKNLSDCKDSDFFSKTENNLARIAQFFTDFKLFRITV